MIEIISSKIENGNMTQCLSSDGKENRIKFFHQNNIDEKNSIFLNVQNQNVIGDFINEKVKIINGVNSRYISADSAITNDDTFIYCLFGDCLPLVIYDKEHEIVSLSHMGWQSLKNNLHIDVVNYFVDNFSSKVEKLDVYIGPSIKKESYMVSKSIKMVDNIKKQGSKYVTEDSSYYYIDLLGYLVDTLKKIGVKNIKIDDIDTYKSKKYFSHHRSKMLNEQDGRFVYGVRMKRG